MYEYAVPDHIMDGIKSEREHQLAKWGERGHEIGAWLTIMRAELTEAEQAWCKQKTNNEAIAEILQVVSVGIACLEQHGCITRETLRIIQGKAK